MSDLARYYDGSYPPSLWQGDTTPVTLASISPTTSPVAAQPFTLTCTGTNITAGTVILINDAPVTTVFGSGSSCSCSISGRTAATYSVKLRDSGVTTAARSLTITATGEDPESEIVSMALEDE